MKLHDTSCPKVPGEAKGEGVKPIYLAPCVNTQIQSQGVIKAAGSNTMTLGSVEYIR